jgi:hypothetical protein
LAAEALGELGDPRAIEVLLNVSNHILSEPDIAPAIGGLPLPEDVEVDESMLRLLLSVAIALAKLGNHTMASIVISLLHYNSSDVYSDDEMIRTQAARALQYIVGSGIFRALQDALHDAYDEVRLNAIDAIFYLGIRDAISELILCVNDESTRVSEHVLTRLGDLTGKRFEDAVQLEDLQMWWSQHEKEYDSGICYRLGKPLWLPDVIALLKKKLQKSQVIQELQIITGLDFGYSPHVAVKSQTAVLKRAQAWWEQEGGHFEAGSLYKYGYKQDTRALF